MEQKRYIYEILRSLERHGGRAELRPTIYGEVFDALKGDLTPNDLGDTNFGDEEKWTNEIRQARRTMIEYGLLEPKEITGRVGDHDRWPRVHCCLSKRSALEFGWC